MKINITKKIALFAFFSTIWLFLSGFLDNGFLLTLGVISVISTIYIAKKMDILDSNIYQFRWFIPMARYWLYLIREIFTSNLNVAKCVIQGNSAISPTVQTFKLNLKTDFGKSIYANSITLTPGTITIRVNTNTIIVHALSQAGLEGVANNIMQQKVELLESTGIIIPLTDKKDNPHVS